MADPTASTHPNPGPGLVPPRPDSTAVRVALWRALHLLVDADPPVLEDDVGLRLVAPDAHWRARPDMDPQGTRGYRAAIVGRARFVEDQVVEAAAHGTTQYVILGAGLDSFAQRRPELAARLRIFEIDQPGPQAWKQQRLAQAGLAVPAGLRFVPVDFEAGESWWEHLLHAGFDPRQPALVASTGVSVYLTHEANDALLRQLASTLAPGSLLLMTFILPLELLPGSERAQHEEVYRRAAAAGTPFLSFFAPGEIVALALAAGFGEARDISTADLTQRYFSGRSDGLAPAAGEGMLVARN